MALIPKNDVNQIFGSQAPDQDKPAQFNNYTGGWDASRINNGKPTIKQFNYLQQRTDQNILYIHQNGGALPYDSTIEYAENATVLIDGELKQKKGNQWVSIGVKNDSDITTWSGRNQRDKNLESVSLLDFGSNYNSDMTSSFNDAIDYLHKKGGGVLHAPIHTGTLKLDGVLNLKENVTVICDDGLIIDTSAKTTGYSITAIGSIDQEVLLGADVTTTNTTITTGTPHNYTTGDYVLIKSQRECAHPDATDAWRLGETTANTVSPFFAELIQVRSVQNSNSFSIYKGLVFPDYRVDKSQETSPTARECTTLQKINFLKGVKWIGGTFKKDSGSVFRLEYCDNPKIKASYEWGYGTGQAVYFTKCLQADIKSYVNRPSNWSLNGNNHASFNSVKDVSNWYSTVTHVERNGSQGVDQTFTDICGIGSEYKVVHFNSHEDGMTTHGCIYGADINVLAYNCAISALRNRARFSRVKVKSINCASGVYLSTWGAVDGDFDVDCIGITQYGINVANDGVTAQAPPFKNSTFKLRCIMSTRNAGGLRIDGYESANTENSGIIISKLVTKGGNRALSVGTGINAVSLSGVIVSDVSPTNQPIWFDRSAGHIFKDMYIDLSNQDGSKEAVLISTLPTFALRTAYGTGTSDFDYESIRIINGKVHSDDDEVSSFSRTLTGTTTSNAVHVITKLNCKGSHFINIAANTSNGNCRINIGEALAVGQKLDIYLNIPTGVTLVNSNIGFYITSSVGSLIFTGSKTKLVGGNMLNLTETTKVTLGRLRGDIYFVEVP